MKIIFVVNDLGVNEPFGPMILSAILKEKGHQTTLGVIQKEDVMEKILVWKPDVVAYSMMSVDMKDFKSFNDKLRNKKTIFTILGGPHATLDRSCINDPGIDAICVGEGDETIVDVINQLEKGESLEGIPNIMTSEDSQLKLRNFIKDFDTIPFMDRELVYSYPEMARFGIKGIWTSRGCVFPCPYCFNNRYNMLYRKKGKIVRRRSVSSIINETKQLMSNYRVAFIRIQDDVFIYKVDDWLKVFSEKWSSEIRTPFYCLLRSELVTEEMAYYLKKAGCFSICMSIEAADDNVRNKMLRRRLSKEKLKNAFHIFKKYGINVYANTMLALPFTTIDHDITSLDFAIEVQPEMPNFSIFMPYPGTDLGDYCKSTGISNLEENIDYGMRNMSPLTCFSSKQKEMQYNLCQLAIVAVKFPRFRNLVVNNLIKWKPNKLFFFIHYFFAIIAYGQKIFYYKHTPIEYIELFSRTIRHYLYDFMKKEDEKDPGEKRRPGRDTRFASKKEGFSELEKCMEAMSKQNQSY